jgi:hypothetical protein
MTLAVSGPLLFARYAYPPNRLGYCGGDDAQALLEQTSSQVDDRGLRQSLRAFEGAWPYLELIAAANRIADPLDARVVEAYWIGSPLLDQVTPTLLGASLDDRFRRRVGRDWDRLSGALSLGAVPHHSFHVFGVYPFLGLLRGGVVEQPLEVLQKCRIRWGRLVHCDGDAATVRSRPLLWDGRRLTLGEPRVEVAVLGTGALRLTRPLAAGDWCSLHWDWVCDRISADQVRRLEHYTLAELAAANEAPATVLA